MKKPIAVVGFGSLVWDLDTLRSHVTGRWQMDAGPVMPLEFSRISPKRKQALALCVDLMDGVPSKTSVIHSTRGDVQQARRDLAVRERAPVGFIGGVCLDTRQSHGRGQSAWMVWQWCERAGYSGAVWMDIWANFTAQRGIGFSVRDGIDYLRTLDEDGLAEAVQYIERAPASVRTHLRRGLADDPWWQEQKARFMPAEG